MLCCVANFTIKMSYNTPDSTRQLLNHMVKITENDSRTETNWSTTLIQW